MAKVTHGAVASTQGSAKAGPKVLRDQLNAERGEHPIAYMSRKGADGAWIIPPGPVYNASNGVQVGWEDGVHLDFRGVGVTRPYDVKGNSVDEALAKRIDEFIKSRHPLVTELGLEKLEPKAPRPPFAKWDGLSPQAIKVALGAILGDDHDENVKVVQDAARYEAANQDRDEVMAILSGMLATEAGSSDAFDVEVKIK